MRGGALPWRRTKRLMVAVSVGVVSLILGGCAAEDALPLPHCAASGSGLIVAQAVPTATQVPCLDPLPRGWSAASTSVDQDRAVITLDSDRAGDEAAVLRFESTCDTTNAVSAPSEFRDTERYDLIEQLEPNFRARRYYVFAGGCVTWVFSFDGDAPTSASIAVGDSLDLLSRDALNELLSEDFIDRDL